MHEAANAFCTTVTGDLLRTKYFSLWSLALPPSRTLSPASPFLLPCLSCKMLREACIHEKTFPAVLPHLLCIEFSSDAVPSSAYKIIKRGSVYR